MAFSKLIPSPRLLTIDRKLLKAVFFFNPLYSVVVFSILKEFPFEFPFDSLKTENAES